MIYDFLKRFVDIIGSLLGILFLLPVFIIVAILVKLDSPGPVFADTPERSGRKGKLFKIYKFRSMVQNAHELLEKNPQLLEEYKKNSYKIFNDPRITEIGKFLRRFSLDELPQFFNILTANKLSLCQVQKYFFLQNREWFPRRRTKEFMK